MSTMSEGARPCLRKKRTVSATVSHRIKARPTLRRHAWQTLSAQAPMRGISQRDINNRMIGLTRGLYPSGQSLQTLSVGSQATASRKPFTLSSQTSGFLSIDTRRPVDPPTATANPCRLRIRGKIQTSLQAVVKAARHHSCS